MPSCRVFRTVGQCKCLFLFPTQIFHTRSTHRQSSICWEHLKCMLQARQEPLIPNSHDQLTNTPCPQNSLFLYLPYVSYLSSSATVIILEGMLSSGHLQSGGALNCLCKTCFGGQTSH